MRRRILLFIFTVVFLCGVILLIQRTNDEMKDVGEVNLLCGKDIYELRGDKISKRYEDKIETFDEPVLSNMMGLLTTVEKPENTDDEDSGLKVQYVGKYIDKEPSDIEYKIYNSSYEMISETDSLNIHFDKGEKYYVSVDVKWGRVKNYICLRYFFAVTT